MIDTKQIAKDIFEEYANYYSQVDLEQLAKILDSIRAEAIKEFSERLKERSFSISIFLFDSINNKPCIEAVKVNDIDNLEKEMAGDTE